MTSMHDNKQLDELRKLGLSPEDKYAQQEVIGFARRRGFVSTGIGRRNSVRLWVSAAVAAVVLGMFAVVNVRLISDRHNAGLTHEPIVSPSSTLLMTPTVPVVATPDRTPTPGRYATPPPRLGAALAYDPSLGSVVMFGGATGTGSALGDTWRWDGTGWFQIPTEGGPPARSFGALAYDAGNRQLVLFGGGSANSDPLRADTWVYDGTGWHQAESAASPPTMGFAMLAYDQASRQMVLVGAPVFSGRPLQTWVWDGRNWSELKTTAQVPWRFNFSLAYYPTVSGVVLFGGYSGAGPGGTMRDTWILRGNVWTPVQSATTPSGGIAMSAIDPPTGVLVAIDSTGTWGFDGSNWTQFAASPANVIYPALAPNPAVGKLVAFGGKRTDLGTATATTLVWSGHGWS